MARGTTLATLRTMLRAEIGQTLNTAAATSGDPTLNQFLASEELWLASSLDWPFLDDRWNVTAGPSSRYLNMPTQTIRGVTASINTERPFQVSVFFNNAWQDV